MGLDMYLYADRYVSSWNEEDKKLSAKVKKLFPELENGQICTIRAIRAEVAYWRKANAIHKWFVDNVQEGNDNCGSYYVSFDNINELLDLCQRVLKNKELAPQLLPTQSGFFFGDTEYGEYYLEDIESTIKQLTKVIADFGEAQNISLYYQSSW